MNQKNSIEVEKIATGIPDIDNEIIPGGIPKGHRILVTGTTGTLKSTFCFHALHEAVTKGMNGAYISLEQSTDSILQQMIEMGYDFSKFTLSSNNLKAIEPFFTGAKDSKKKTMLSIIDIGFERKKLKVEKQRKKFSWLDAIEDQLEKQKKISKPEIIVIDSLNILYHLDIERFGDSATRRRDLFYVIDYLKDLGVTSLIINEIPAGDDRYSQYGIESYLVDGVIQLSQHRRELEVVREFHVVKMRGVNHSLKVYIMTFGPKEKFAMKRKIATE